MKIKKSRIFSGIIGAVFLLQSVVGAADIGVNSHMTSQATAGHGRKAVVKATKAANMQWIRDEVPWGEGGASYGTAVEKSKGVLKMPETVELNVNEAHENGLNVLMILHSGNRLYDGETSYTIPTSSNPEYFNAYVRYAEYVAQYFKGRVQAYEVWNEPNHPGFNPGGATAAQYAELYLATKDAIKAIDPNATVLCGAVAGPDSQYIDDILSYISAHGGVSQIDAISVHQYQINPENELLGAGYLKTLNNIEKVFDKYNYTGDVWMTETGYYTGSAEGAMGEGEVAAHMLRCVVTYHHWLQKNSRDGVCFIYELRDDKPLGSTDSQYYGMLDYDYNSKPLYNTMQCFDKLVMDKDFVERTVSSSKYLYKYINSTTNETAYIAYSTSGTQNISIPASGDAAYVYDYRGRIEQIINNPSGNISVSVGAYPKMVEFVDYSSRIDDISYDADKNILTVKGFYEYGNTATITLTSASENQSTEVTVEPNGEFTYWFPVNSDAEYTVTVAKEEIQAFGQSSGWASETVETSRSTDDTSGGIADGCTAVFNNGQITVSARLNNYKESDDATVLVVPQSKQIENITAKDIVYANQIELENGDLNFSFKLAADAEGDYSIYLSSTRATESKNTSVNVGDVTQYVKVTDLSIQNGSVGKVTASAKFKNYNQTEKTAQFIIVQYSGEGQLLDVHIEEVTVPAGTVMGEVNIAEADVVPGAANINTYVWDDLKSIVPLTPVVTLK